MNSKFTFIDLFAGIGGFHLAMESLGGECVFASEIDKDARKTYEHNFRKHNATLFDNGMFNDDIKQISAESIPDFDVLCAGFPCQPFSQAGYKLGFEDNRNSERGNLFFNILEILEAKKPQAFFLENVRGIVNHDKGNTFRVIQELIDKAGYSFYFQVVKASDYGLPQLRPRAFMIGFRDDSILGNFSFPEPKPLRFNMSDVWGGECSRELGFTLRVGGRGSSIDDRRNWDSYLVDGKVKQLGPIQAKKMQGFPDNFEFPVSNTQAMKQLGNSVAVDAVKCCASSLVDYMFELQKNNKDDAMIANKGEWSEVYSLFKLANDRILYLSDSNLKPKGPIFDVHSVSTENTNKTIDLSQPGTINIVDDNGSVMNTYNVSNTLLNNSSLSSFFSEIINGSRTFNCPTGDAIGQSINFPVAKGGNSKQKSDLVIDLKDANAFYAKQGMGVKSYVGSKPTLLNASSNTNLVFEVSGLNASAIPVVNAISTKTKIIDRLNSIASQGGALSFSHFEKQVMGNNVSMVDGDLPKIISDMLYIFYTSKYSKLSEIVQYYASTNSHGFSAQAIEVKVKRFLVSVMLGMFAGAPWNGQYEANGTIVVLKNGNQVAFHITDLTELENYLYSHLKFDKPQVRRHQYAALYFQNNKLYFKLNLQIRF